MGISNLEDFLERHIEGFFNKKFSSELELSEVVKQLEHELMKSRRKAKTESIAANSYTIKMSDEDYKRLCSKRLLDDLYLSVCRKAILEDLYIDGPLRIKTERSKELSLGMCKVEAQFAAEEEENLHEDSSTIVLDKSIFNPPLNLPTEHITASLSAVRGPDKDSYLEIGEKQIYIGRRESNEFILTDTGASRLHAYISYDRHRHFIHDADSLNGTLVNGKRITSACLKNGDEIAIGSSVLIYEAL